MTQGFVASFDTRRRRGFVQLGRKADLIPFSVHQSEAALTTGDAVEFAVIGGKAGLMAQNVRPLRRR
ncbi:MAG: cold shock domain-containing protein [Bacteroidetes bacterium]|nr:cold shock domain-containing protein [Bacteroidota bacterium]